MKFAVKFVFISIWIHATSAFAAIAEDISRPAIKDLIFSYHSIAVVTERESYIFDRKYEPTKPHPSGYGLERPNSGIGVARRHSGALGKDFLHGTETKKQMETLWDPVSTVHVTNWVTESGAKFSSIDGYCGEGQDDYHLLSFNLRELNTHLPGCESISDLMLLDDQLWLGSYEQHEMSSGGGSGVRVVSLRTKKLIAAYSPNQKSMTGYVTPLNFDAASGKLTAVKKSAAGRINSGRIIVQSHGQLADGFVKFIRRDVTTPNDVWVLTETALHRIVHGKVKERWYLSEQFNSEGQVTLFADLKPQRSNPWAILARETKLMNTFPIWKQLQQSPKLAKRLTYQYEDEGHFFRIDGNRISGYDDKGEVIVKTWEYDRGSSEVAQQIINRLKSK
jgi:hypothetical protein